ncbi:MAG: ATP-binding protein [Thiotrichaceae bacterium]|nr:ATP-binding protein [Thiotrichaceae bacterium]
MNEFLIIDNNININSLDKNIIKPANELIQELDMLDENIDKISFSLVLNNRFEDLSKFFSNKLVSIIDLNTPIVMSGTQDIKISSFKNKMKDLLLNNTPFPSGVDHLSLLILYNKKFNQVNIKGLDATDHLNKPEAFFIPRKPIYSLDQVILTDFLESEISSALMILKKRELIYETWGFNEIEPSPKSILNFFGPPGTGKTMTANAIAHHLEINIMALNYADIESKYVGEAPKNLVKAFEIAEKEEALLFFDEADSFLGKRITNVSSSSDQAVNSLRSQMLILLEGYNGIIIFATNLIENYDKAFESRIFKHIKFDLPSKTQRIALIKKLTPTKLPFEKEITSKQFISLADLSEGFSGRNIKNAILNTLTDVALKDMKYFKFDDFNVSFTNMSMRLSSLHSTSIDIGKIEDKIKLQLNNRNTNKTLDSLETN